MKIAERTHTDIVAGTMDEIPVTIAANAVSFHAQISGLAKNKIEYPMREICSNAWDAARGDFDVQLPTALDPVFRVRDRGPGMSHEMMVSIYAVIYASTKRDSDTEVGGWGLGRFSPFAYLIGEDGAASYTVTSYHGGRARTYLLSVGERGPTLRLLGDMDSDEPTGMEVMFAVRTGDIDAFHMAAKRILWAFEPRPNLVPEIEFPETSVRLSGPGWAVHTGNLPFTGPQVRMGCAYYPIELSQIDNPGQVIRSNTPVLFDIPIGSVSVTLSREALAYDERTKRTVSQAVARYVADYAAAIQEKVETAATYFEACRTFRGQMDHEKFTETVTWRGLPLLKYVFFKDGLDMVRTMGLSDGWTASNTKQFEHGAFECQHAIGRTLVLEHTPSHSIDRLKAAGLEGKPLVWVRIKRVHREAFLASIGNPSCITLDDFASAALAGRPKTLRRRKTLVVTATGVQEETRELDMAAGGLYIRNWGMARSYYRSYRDVQVTESKSVQASALQTGITTLVRIGLMSVGQVILLATEQESPPEGWSWFGDSMHARLLPLATGFRPTGLEGKNQDSLSGGLRFLLRLAPGTRMPADLNELIQDARDLDRQLQQSSTRTSSEATAYDLIQHFGHRPDLPQGVMRPDPIGLVEARYTAMTARYPLLRLITSCFSRSGSYYASSMSRDDVMRGAVDYLRLLTNDTSHQRQEAA